MNRIKEIFFLVLFAAVFHLTCGTTFANQPSFHAEKEVMELDELRLTDGITLGRKVVREISIDTSSCHIYGSGIEGYSCITIDGCNPFGEPGEPKLPMRTVTVKLKINQKPVGIEVVQGKYRDISGRIRIIPRPVPLEWKSGGSAPEYSPNVEIYSSKELYPGKVVSFDFGSDGENTIVYIRFFPIQYSPALNKVILITDAKLMLYYEECASAADNPKRILFSEQSFIICPAVLESKAEALSAFHAESLDISSRVITTEYIDGAYSPAEDPPEDGYATDPPDWLSEYDYNLALKTVSFLRESHPNLKYITIIGDALLVPPSYYFNDNSDYYDDWTAWVPSDIYYMSPDYDFVPNYALGRISVNSSNEAETVINKIIAWHSNADWDSFFKYAIVAGGQPFNTIYYHGELIIENMINANLLEGHDIERYFRTDEKFTKYFIEPEMSGGGCGIFYFVAHGSGNNIYFDDDYFIEPDEIMSYSATTQTPIFMTPACINGIYDIDLVEADFDTGFAEALLKSPGGAIAYFGGSRSNYGMSTFHIDQGNLIFEKEEYMTGMFYYIMDAYHNGDSILGDMQTAAINSYLFNNDMDEQTNKYTIECFILHGDPVLPIPPQPCVFMDSMPWIEASTPTFTSAAGFPSYHTPDLSGPIELTAVSEATELELKFLKPIAAWGTDPDVETWTDYTAPFNHSFVPDDSNSVFLFRAMMPDSRERWFFLHTYAGLIFPDGDRTDWEMIGEIPVASDPDDFSDNAFELTDLYATYEDNAFYFAFDIFPEDTDNVTYLIAIDCISGGYTGIEGMDCDAGYNYVTFSGYAVDYEIVIYNSSWGTYAELQRYAGGYWDWVSPSFWDYPDANLVGISAEGQFCEVQLPDDWIGEPLEMDVVVYSANYSPAQDAVPSNPSTYTTPHLDSGDANTLTEFVHVYGVAIDEKTHPKPEMEIEMNCRPNPFNKACRISIVWESDAIDTDVEIDVCDISGRTLEKLCLPAGHDEIIWRPDNDLPGGLLIMRCRIGEKVTVKKALFVK